MKILEFKNKKLIVCENNNKVKYHASHTISIDENKELVLFEKYVFNLFQPLHSANDDSFFELLVAEDFENYIINKKPVHQDFKNISENNLRGYNSILLMKVKNKNNDYEILNIERTIDTLNALRLMHKLTNQDTNDGKGSYINGRSTSFRPYGSY